LKVAVVTPYYDEPLDVLRHCHESVARQRHRCLHVMVGDGKPRAELGGWQVDHVTLPRAHADIGSTPRLIGSYHAIGLGFDAIAFLDADNWYREDHVESLVQLHQTTGAGLVSSSRMLCRLDGSVMGPCPIGDPEKFVDTNCMMVTRRGFHVLARWVLMPSYAHLIGDRVMLYYFRQAGVSHAHSGAPSVFYRCGKEGLYRQMGEPIPPGVKPRPDYDSSFRKWVEDGNPPLI
jgi:hypothetical protein